MKLTEAIGKRLSDLLAERKISQYQIYKEGGVPRATISQTINAKKGTVKMDTVYQITSTLGISLKDFFDDPLFDDLED